MPIPRENLIQQIEEAFAQSTADSRLAALWFATDVLLTGQYSEEQIWMFGEIIDRLAAEIEMQARARLSERLSRSDHAPLQTIRKLAFDDSFEVAEPVLVHSPRLSDETLVEATRSKSQRHLEAIARRESLSETVTDALVDHGNGQVIRRVAGNGGARFSERGFLSMATRCENDAILVETLGRRKDIPRRIFVQLVAKASEEAKKRLAAIGPVSRDDIEHIVADVAGDVQSTVGPASKEYFEVKRSLKDKHRRGQLGEKQFLELIWAKKATEVAVAFSLLSGLSVDAVERALIADDADMLMVIGKSADLSWMAVRALLLQRTSAASLSLDEIEVARRKYSRLSVGAARNVIALYHGRRTSAMH